MLAYIAEKEEEDGGVEVARGNGGGRRVVGEGLRRRLEGTGETAES